MLPQRTNTSYPPGNQHIPFPPALLSRFFSFSHGGICQLPGGNSTWQRHQWSLCFYSSTLSWGCTHLHPWRASKVTQIHGQSRCLFRCLIPFQKHSYFFYLFVLYMCIKVFFPILGAGPFQVFFYVSFF